MTTRKWLVSRPASSRMWNANPTGASRSAICSPSQGIRSVHVTPGPTTSGRPAKTVAAGVWA